MLDLKTVAEVLNTTPAKVRQAVKFLGNVGSMGRNGSILLKSDDIDRIKAHLEGK